MPAIRSTPDEQFFQRARIRVAIAALSLAPGIVALQVVRLLLHALTELDARHAIEYALIPGSIASIAAYPWIARVVARSGIGVTRDELILRAPFSWSPVRIPLRDVLGVRVAPEPKVWWFPQLPPTLFIDVRRRGELMVPTIADAEGARRAILERLAARSDAS